MNIMINNFKMKAFVVVFSLFFGLAKMSFAQSSDKTTQEILRLSKDKWQWMADKDVDKLGKLFDNQAMFVHMGGSWGKERELEIIKSGFIHYKKADIHEVLAPIVIGNTVILLNRITLLAVVGNNEVSNPFMVTEVYVKVGNEWKMGSLSFSKLMTP
jgi:predicted NAD/FAD-dependent oxidoreductase